MNELKVKGGTGTPVTLENYLAWKEKKVAARKATDEEELRERHKKKLFTGKELVEEITNDTDDKTEGEDEITRLLAERAKANQESEDAARKEAEENLARAKELGDLYNEDMLPDDDRGMMDDLEEDLVVPEGWSEDAIAPNVVAGTREAKEIMSALEVPEQKGMTEKQKKILEEKKKLEEERKSLFGVAHAYARSLAMIQENGEWGGQWRREKMGKMNSLNGGEGNRKWERWKDRKD